VAGIAHGLVEVIRRVIPNEIVGGDIVCFSFFPQSF
jgi:hypothetical protein